MSYAKQILNAGKHALIESHYDYFGTLYNLAVHTTDQIIRLLGIPDNTHFDVRSIHKSFCQYKHVCDGCKIAWKPLNAY